MSAMREVEWLPPLLDRHPAPDRFARIKSSAGHAEPAIGYLMASDWLPEACAELNRMLFTRTHLAHELAELVALAVSQESSCRYCFAATRTLLIMVGYPRERIRRLERMSGALTENRGHVSKFIGDGILALFGALAPNPWQADDAVRALPPLSLKGVSEPVAVWAVMGPADRVQQPAAVPQGRS
jgi:AhpD family alkylhydroperoxidase